MKITITPDEQTIELDGRFYDLRKEEPKVERNIHEDVYLENPEGHATWYGRDGFEHWLCAKRA